MKTQIGDILCHECGETNNPHENTEILNEFTSILTCENCDNEILIDCIPVDGRNLIAKEEKS